MGWLTWALLVPLSMLVSCSYPDFTIGNRTATPREYIGLLQEIHSSQLKKFKYEEDKVNEWRSKGVGDCEDFAISCMLSLDKVGISSRLVYCKDENGDGHMVASASGFILDNRLRSVFHYTEVPYTWIKISGMDKWYYINRQEISDD